MIRACRLPRKYILVVAEKPKAAQKIATAIGNPIKCSMRRIPYWVLSIGNTNVVVASTAGHMYGPYSSNGGLPVFDYEWRPLWEFDKSSKHLKLFFEVLKTLSRGAYLFVNACDYDIEGSLIGYMVIANLGGASRMKRMKFSSLSPLELRSAFRNLQEPDLEMVEAGRARHELDWLWGINISRALMKAFQSATGRRRILSAGRVQSPTLIEAVNRWSRINKHVPLPRFSLTVSLAKDSKEFTATPLSWSPSTRKEAYRIAEQLKKNGYLIVHDYWESIEKIRPPPAFNLGDLQAEASKLFGFSPMKTQKIAEDLYLDALISYPRTNSQQLPSTVNYYSIIKQLERGPLGVLASRLLKTRGHSLAPIQGKKTDPAHPAIYPTGETPRGLDKDHMAVYELIVRRFLAAFAEPLVVKRVTVTLLDDSGRKYRSQGNIVVRKGWLAFYNYYRIDEAMLPDLKKGEKVKVAKVSIGTTWEAPNLRVSKIELLKWMESVRIGTEATRARIIEILFKRGYLEPRGPTSEVTELGYTVAKILQELFPQLSTPGLTREFEEKLDLIRAGKLERSRVVEEAKSVIKTLLNDYWERLSMVGSRLAKALNARSPESPCMVCGRETIEGENLCEIHTEALRELGEKLPVIAEKLGVSRREALERISKLKHTGAWVKELIAFASKNSQMLRALIDQG
ncbi:MAG: DNA topoisomerase I [Desulfurococcales archaeon]|nr:DNA topoisomerase I [Desulfurococcales archaeon]